MVAIPPGQLYNMIKAKQDAVAQRRQMELAPQEPQPAQYQEPTQTNAQKLAPDIQRQAQLQREMGYGPRNTNPNQDTYLGRINSVQPRPEGWSQTPRGSKPMPDVVYTDRHGADKYPARKEPGGYYDYGKFHKNEILDPTLVDLLDPLTGEVKKVPQSSIHFFSPNAGKISVNSPRTRTVDPRSIDMGSAPLVIANSVNRAAKGAMQLPKIIGRMAERVHQDAPDIDSNFRSQFMIQLRNKYSGYDGSKPMPVRKLPWEK